MLPHLILNQLSQYRLASEHESKKSADLSDKMPKTNKADLKPQLDKLIADYSSRRLSIFGKANRQNRLDTLLEQDADLTQLKAYLAKHDQGNPVTRFFVELFWPTTQKRSSLCLHELKALNDDLAQSAATPGRFTERFNFIKTQASHLKVTGVVYACP